MAHQQPPYFAPPSKRQHQTRPVSPSHSARCSLPLPGPSVDTAGNAIPRPKPLVLANPNQFTNEDVRTCDEAIAFILPPPPPKAPSPALHPFVLLHSQCAFALFQVLFYSILFIARLMIPVSPLFALFVVWDGSGTGAA
ncbi:hypothetical protein N7510_006933 [Penicillium lagena]|uniref:uncharacterized protein n=1 Tax=Penicillium lagena TaxID=94218 RepID=UPI002541A74F|nr:uncharacterized protein N7510_006933 [Penicillium lagena]KAJ5610214.1 hypothetical protein N7510_006933 [Penicillium lagena]